MPSDSAHAKFLYTILKQLDLKSIDWTAVASQLDITNGHAARMRFSRFKQHMEGVQPSPRRRAGTAGPSSSTSGSTGSGSGKSGSGRVKKKEKDGKGKKRVASTSAAAEEPAEKSVKTEPGVAEAAMPAPPSGTVLSPQQQSFEESLGAMQTFHSPPTAAMTTTDFSAVGLEGDLYGAYGGGQMPVMTAEMVPRQMQQALGREMGNGRAARRGPNGEVLVKLEPWED